MNTHYIHRPTPPGGETDGRYRELTADFAIANGVEYWDGSGWYRNIFRQSKAVIWRIPGSDAPSAETIELAKGVG